MTDRAQGEPRGLPRLVKAAAGRRRDVVAPWPALMKPATARAYLDNMGREKFRAQVAPHLTTRTIGERSYYLKAQLDQFLGLDDPGATRERPNPLDLLKALANDLATSPRRQALRR